MSIVIAYSTRGDTRNSNMTEAADLRLYISLWNILIHKARECAVSLCTCRYRPKITITAKCIFRTLFVSETQVYLVPTLLKLNTSSQPVIRKVPPPMFSIFLSPRLLQYAVISRNESRPPTCLFLLPPFSPNFKIPPLALTSKISISFTLTSPFHEKQTSVLMVRNCYVECRASPNLEWEAIFR